MCEADEYQCNTHECVPASARCDGERQCLEGSDEANCLHLVSAQSGEITGDNTGILVVGDPGSLNLVCGLRWSPPSSGTEWANLACR